MKIFKMKIFKKKIEFVSKEEHKKVMDNITIILNGMTVASNQQAQMLASLANQMSMITKSQKPQEKEEEKVEYDEAFQ